MTRTESKRADLRAKTGPGPNGGAGRRRDRSAIQILILAALVLLGVIWIPHTASEDIPYWLLWMKTDLSVGIVHGYQQAPLEYPPLSRFILAVPARFAQATGADPAIAMKVTFLLAWCATGALFFASTRDRWITLALMASLLVNNLGIGYLDAYVAPLLVVSLHLLKKEKWPAAFVVLILSSFVKWQPGIFGPFMVAYILARLIREARKGWAVPAAVSLGLPAVAIPGILYLVFGPVLVGTFRYASNNIFISGNALNLNWIYTVLLHALDPGRFGALGAGEILIQRAPAGFLIAPKVIFWGIYLYFLVRCAMRAVRFADFLSYAALGYFSYFMFNTAVHENHLVLLLVPLAFLAHERLRLRWIALAIAIFVNLNLVLFYGVDGREVQFPKSVAGAWVTAFASLLGFGMYLWTVKEMGKESGRGIPGRG